MDKLCAPPEHKMLVFMQENIDTSNRNLTMQLISDPEGCRLSLRNFNEQVTPYCTSCSLISNMVGEGVV